MLAWEERDKLCMVSTIVDGIDNGAVEDVMSLYTGQAILCLTDTITWKNPPGKTES